MKFWAGIGRAWIRTLDLQLKEDVCNDSWVMKTAVSLY